MTDTESRVQLRYRGGGLVFPQGVAVWSDIDLHLPNRPALTMSWEEAEELRDTLSAWIEERKERPEWR